MESIGNLKWMIEEFLSFHITKNKNNLEVTSSTAEAYCKFSREEITNICGTFYITGEETCTFVLDDHSYRVPCIVTNPASNIQRLFKLLDNKVLVRKGHFVAERYAQRDGDKPLVWLQVAVDDMIILDVGKPDSSPPPLAETHWDLRVLVAHVSTPIITTRSGAFALVLVLTKLPGSDRSQYLWILLTGKQLIWNQFLIANREYDIHLTCDKDNFALETRHLKDAVRSITGASQHLYEVLHHDTMWPTTDTVSLPPDTQLSLQPSSVDRLSTFNCKWPSVWWMSIDEALAQDASQLTFSIWGEVVKVFDDDNTVTKSSKQSCSLCPLRPSEANSRGVVGARGNFKMADAGTIYDPWESELRMEGGPLRVPLSSSDHLAGDTDRKGLDLPRLPAKLTKNVTLKDTQSGKQVCVYVKNWASHQYAPLFTPGVLLCCRFVQRRASRNGNAYFTTCALSSFEVIGCSTDISNIGGSCLKHGFPHAEFEVHDKVWGVMDSWKVVKVTMGHEDRTHFIACATVLVERHSGDPVLVFLRDQNVRLLLGLPLKIWTDLIEMTRDVPLDFTANPSQMRVDDMCELESLFHACCSLANAERKRFHIVCRCLSKAGGDYSSDLFFCVSLSEADSQHLEDIKDVSTFFFANQNSPF
ncbi:uncharacterized protein LOC111046489 [Nilaparvata lugens]|uniref:uncharacterized protein LOC111046489 n=1 Tax=Nilaparvata lugens TaxID=108931 RepID=UPI00193E2F5E|nr:uncharacterized protein LOC111046489 [Nilaparvata lugens]